MPESRKVPIQQSQDYAVAFGMPKEEVDGKDGLILAIEQLLGGVAPQRQSPVQFQERPGKPLTAVYSEEPNRHGIIPLKPTQELRDGAQTLVQMAMGETQSQEPEKLRAYITDYLTKGGLLK